MRNQNEGRSAWVRRNTEPNVWSNSQNVLGFPVNRYEQEQGMMRPVSEYRGRALYAAHSFPGHWNYFPSTWGPHYGYARSASTGAYSDSYVPDHAAPSGASVREQYKPSNFSASDEEDLGRISPIPFSSITSFEPPEKISGVSGTNPICLEQAPKKISSRERKHCRLHLLCRLKLVSLSDVQKALKENPEAARVRVRLNGVESNSLRGKAGLKKNSVNKGWRRSTYTLPINMAIQNGASLEVLEALINAAPDVLREPDGPDRECALHIAIKYNIASQFIDMMLLANPKASEAADRQNNTPLHVACLLRPTEVELIKHLHVLNPQARSKRNMHGRTPLEMMHQTTFNVSEQALDFMQELEIKEDLNDTGN